MKKIFGIVFSVAVLFGVFACGGGGGSNAFEIITEPTVYESGYGFITITGKIKNITGKYQDYVQAKCTVMQDGVQIADTLGNESLAKDAIWEYQSLGQLSPSAQNAPVTIECQYKTSPF